MSIKILKVALPIALNNIRQGSTFLSVMGYTNNFGEVSNFGLVFHANYLKAVNNAIKIWSDYNPRTETEKLAKRELLDSFHATLRGHSRSKVAHIYSPISDGNRVVNGIKYHDRLDVIHLNGFLVHKRILKQGNYHVRVRSSYIVTKDKLRNMTKLTRFRQFKLTDETFKKISVDKLNLTQQDLI